MGNPKSKPKLPLSKAPGETKATMWSTFGSAAEGGWGQTVRLILIVIVLGAVLVGIIVASGGPELLGIGGAAKALVTWIRTHV